MPLYKEALPLLAGLFVYYLKGSSQVLDNRSILKGENIYTFRLKDLYFSNKTSIPFTQKIRTDYPKHLYFLIDPEYKINKACTLFSHLSAYFRFCYSVSAAVQTEAKR